MAWSPDGIKIIRQKSLEMLKASFVVLLPVCWLSASSLDKTLDLMEKQELYQYIQEEKEKENLSKYNIQEEQKLKIDNKEKFIFEKIILFDNDIVVSNVDYIFKDFLNKEIGVQEVYTLVEKLTNYFLTKGYSTTAIGIRKFDKENKILEFEVYDGLVGSIILNGQTNSLRTLFALPLKRGDRFNIFDLDMGIENLSEVSRDQDVLIQPSEEEGYSDILITDKVKPIGMSVSFDNSGAEQKGTYKLNLGVSINNLTHTNDVLGVSFNTYPIQKKDIQEYGFRFNYTLPFGYNQFYLSSQFLQSTDSSLDFLLVNRACNYLVGYKRIVKRSQSSKYSLYLNIPIKQRLNKVNDQVLSLSSKTYGSVVSGFEYSNSIHRGFFYIALEYERGIPLEKADEYSIYKDDYNKFNINASFQYNFVLPKNLYLSYATILSGSYSDRTLLSLNKFSIGDEYSVRGFKKYSVDLDYGFYTNNTLSLGFISENKFLQNLQIFLGLDFGWGRDYLLSSDDVLVGSALGVKYLHQNFNASFVISKAIYKPTSLPSDGYPIYFRIGMVM